MEPIKIPENCREMLLLKRQMVINAERDLKEYCAGIRDSLGIDRQKKITVDFKDMLLIEDIEIK